MSRRNPNEGVGSRQAVQTPATTQKTAPNTADTESKTKKTERTNELRQLVDHVLETLTGWRAFAAGPRDDEHGGSGEALRTILQHVEWSKLDPGVLGAVLTLVLGAQDDRTLVSTHEASLAERKVLHEAKADERGAA